jgi:hypothetical protein
MTNNFPILAVDWTNSAKRLVMISHLEQATFWYFSAARNILQERQDVFRGLRASERQDEDRIVVKVSSIQVRHWFLTRV